MRFIHAIYAILGIVTIITMAITYYSSPEVPERDKIHTDVTELTVTSTAGIMCVLLYGKSGTAGMIKLYDGKCKTPDEE